MVFVETLRFSLSSEKRRCEHRYSSESGLENDEAECLDMRWWLSEMNEEEWKDSQLTTRPIFACHVVKCGAVN